MSPSRAIRRAGLLGSLALFAIWLVILRPVALGGPAAYVIVTGASMEPGLHAGDLVLAFQAPAYKVGDAVVYRIPRGEGYDGHLVIHRILDGDPEAGFILQGDNAAHRDPWRVTTADVVGQVAVMVPAGGRVLIFLRNPLIAGSLAAGFTFVLVAWPSSRGRRKDQPPRAGLGTERHLPDWLAERLAGRGQVAPLRSTIIRPVLLAIVLLAASAGVSAAVVLAHAARPAPSSPAMIVLAGPLGSPSPSGTPRGVPTATHFPVTSIAVPIEARLSPAPGLPPTDPVPSVGPAILPTSSALRAAATLPGSDRYQLLVACPGTPGCWVYSVRSGDNLSSIARYFGVPLATLYDRNPSLRTPPLKAGIKLLLPAPSR